jgi:16S rRNA (guanine(1405)-N(7))-methyltransferase
MTARDADIHRLVEQVRRSSKYAAVSLTLIAEIGADELAVRRSFKEAVESTKRKLHQVAGAYLPAADYAAWLERLEQAAQVPGTFRGARRLSDLRRVCRDIMEHHASTQERLDILKVFYETVLGDLPPIRSVADVACGLGPLAIPWMPLAPGARYYAYDIYEDLTGFLNQALPLLDVETHAETRDVIHHPPEVEVDVALLLKAVPCLDQVQRDAGQRLIETLRARHVVVSFPTESLCGRRKGMTINYEARFWELVDGRGWHIDKHLFDTELVFVVRKEG